MRKTIGFLTVTACLFAAPSEKDRREAAQRLTEASTVFGEIMHAGDKGIPQDLVDKAQCAVIVPGLKKGAFIVGGQFGKGFITTIGDGPRRLPSRLKAVAWAFRSVDPRPTSSCWL